MNQALFAYVNHDRTRFWKESNVSCQSKQMEPLVGFELTADRLLGRRYLLCHAAPDCVRFAIICLSDPKVGFIVFVIMDCVYVHHWSKCNIFNMTMQSNGGLI